MVIKKIIVKKVEVKIENCFCVLQCFVDFQKCSFEIQYKVFSCIFEVVENVCECNEDCVNEWMKDFCFVLVYFVEFFKEWIVVFCIMCFIYCNLVDKSFLLVESWVDIFV